MLLARIWGLLTAPAHDISPTTTKNLVLCFESFIGLPNYNFSRTTDFRQAAFPAA